MSDNKTMDQADAILAIDTVDFDLGTAVHAAFDSVELSSESMEHIRTRLYGPNATSGVTRARQVPRRRNIAAVLLAAALLAMSSVAYALSAGYLVNDKGETYGSVVDMGENGNIAVKPIEPDLQAAIATNGRNGYIREAERRAAIDELHQKDADVLCQEQATALRDTARQLFGIDVIDESVALEYIYEHRSAEKRASVEELLRQNISENVTDAMEAGMIDLNQLDERVSREIQSYHFGEKAFVDGGNGIELSYEAVELVLQKTREATAIVVPVYESDGETVIGEYAGSVM